MDREALINQVKIKLDEYTPPGVSLPFDDYLGPLLDESAIDILEKTPLYLLTSTNIPLVTVTPPASLVKYDDDKAYIPVPSDYIRLFEIKYPLWDKAVRRAITPEDPAYQKQDNEYLKSGYGRPVVAIVHKIISPSTVSVRYLECGKVLDPGQTVLTPTALYVKTCKPEELQDILSDSLTWLCCSKLFLVIGQPDKAKLTYEQFVNSINSLLQ